MFFKKKLISIITAAACIFTGICFYGDNAFRSNTVSAAETTGKTAFELTSQMTVGWNLGNTLDSWNSSLKVDSPPKKFATCWGNPEPTQELFNAIKNGGFNTVRIPTTWFQHLIYNENTDTYEIDKVWMDYVKQTVDYAYNLDMFVILNVHHEEWVNIERFTSETYADASLKLEDIWSQISDTFSNYDQRLIFEGMNEPRETNNPSNSEWGSGDTNSWNYINNLNELFVNTVRNQGSPSNKERLLMLPGYCASAQYEAVNNINIPENSGNIALSVHAYTPYYFTMDTSDKANHSFPGKSGWGADYETELRTLFSTLKSISDNKNVPIIIGEFSASDFNNNSDREAWAECYLSNAKAVGIPCVLWDNNVSYNETGEAHGYLYRATNTWYKNSIGVIKKIMDTLGVTDYSLPEYQEYVKPQFSWDKMEIGDNWIEMYRSDEGKNLAAWKNFTVSNWKELISEDYEYIMFYDSDDAPTLIFQGGWFTVNSDDSMAKDFVAGFTYDEIISTLEANQVSLDQMNNMFISAGSKSATIYALYAVPLNQPQLNGDVNEDGEINVADLVLLQQYLVCKSELTDTQLNAADYNSDGVVNVFDAVALRVSFLTVS